MYKEILITCVKCNNQISSYAKKCPKCNTELHICRICEETVSPDDSYSHSSFFSFPLHKACISPILEISHGVKCPLCGINLKHDLILKEINNSIFRSLEKSPCPKCGHENVLSRRQTCERCLGLIISEIHKFKSTFENGKDYVEHTSCYEKSPKYQEDRKKKRKRRINLGIAVLIICILLVWLSV